MAKIGYARTSTTDQVAGLEAQLRDLRAAGCDERDIYREQASSVRTRPELDLVLARILRPSDTLVVTKIDRLARSIGDLVEIIRRVRAAGAEVTILELGSTDPSSPMGELMVGMLGVLAQFERRAGNDVASEFAAALQEVFFITRLRIAGKVSGDGMPQVNGRLSTHVLDTHAGRPAAGIAVELYEFAGERPCRIATAITNSDGRTDQPLIGGRPLPIGRYELRFAVGNHFRSRGIDVGDPPFLDIVPLRFSIAEPEGHYHVPLLCTPWSYSTYRGS